MVEEVTEEGMKVAALKVVVGWVVAVMEVAEEAAVETAMAEAVDEAARAGAETTAAAAEVVAAAEARASGAAAEVRHSPLVAGVKAVAAQHTQDQAAPNVRPGSASQASLVMEAMRAAAQAAARAAVVSAGAA
jgi:hypothetical protein